MALHEWTGTARESEAINSNSFVTLLAEMLQVRHSQANVCAPGASLLRVSAVDQLLCRSSRTSTTSLSPATVK